MKKQSIKKITLTSLLQVFIVSILIIVSIIALSYRSFFKFVVENEARSVAEIIKAGLTSHMNTGTMDKRSYFLNEISSVYDIESIKIIRADSVSREFGEAGSFEKKLDDDLRKILNKKEPYFQWKERDKIEAIIPYIARSEGTVSCLQCHQVQDGEVLGAVDIVMDTELYQDFVFKNSYIIAGLLFIFSLAIILNMFHVIERYIRKPLSNVIHDGQKAYASQKDINSGDYESREFVEVADNINDFNQNVLKKEAELKDKNTELKMLNEEIESTLRETLLVLGQVEEIRSNETKRHALRVTVICKLIAQEYGLDEEQVKLIELASPLHDVGKIGIADAILNKKDKLSAQEYEVMQSHTVLGHEILRHSDRAVLQAASSIAYGHHEKYDGSGYPQGIKGEKIPIFARIVAIVDVLDALICKRVYKEGWPIEEVVAKLKDERGKHFDPRLVDIVLENIDKYTQIIYELSEDTRV